MFTIAGLVGWIILDLGMFLVTTPPTLPPWLWYGFLGLGLIVGVLALIGEIRDRKADARRDAELKAGQAQHSREHDILAGADLNLGANLALLVQKLEGVTNTHGAPIVKTIEMATEKIERLEAKVSRHDAIFWGALDRDDKEHLTAVLSRLGPHSVRIVADANTDCVELARDLKACFKEAAWPIDGVPLTGTYQAAGASGLSVVFRYGSEAIQRPLVEALSAVAHGQCSGLGNGPSDTPNPDVSITIGPKRLHYDD